MQFEAPRSASQCERGAVSDAMREDQDKAQQEATDSWQLAAVIERWYVDASKPRATRLATALYTAGEAQSCGL